MQRCCMANTSLDKPTMALAAAERYAAGLVSKRRKLNEIERGNRCVCYPLNLIRSPLLS